MDSYHSVVFYYSFSIDCIDKSKSFYLQFFYQDITVQPFLLQPHLCSLLPSSIILLPFLIILSPFLIICLVIVILNYTRCRKINLFQVGGLVGKNLRNLEKIK
jgi:hypothetical protein